MEAPEFIKFIKSWGLGLGAIFIAGIAYPLPARDYEISAHAALTNAIIDTYNAAYPDTEIDDIYRFDLVRGSKEEDDGSRSLNHFYDPVHNRGLSFGGTTWMRSKSWAVADDVNDFTWQKGLDAYAIGDNHRAFLILGHVLHLLEDASVPEHVRNDPHMVESPYESFTKTLVPAKDGAPPVVLADVLQYFDRLAAYTNKGFYSADTIDSAAYDAPKPDYVAQEGKYVYGFKADSGGSNYHLVRYVETNKNFKQAFLVGDDNNKILSDYWRLLSGKAVSYGAGMAHTFIAEGERLKKEKAVTKKQSKSIYATLASVVDIFASTADSVSAEDDGLAEAESIPLEAGVDKALAVQGKSSSAAPASATVKKTSASVATPTAKKTTVKTAPPKACAYGSSVTPTHGPVIINEVAWMGSKVSASDEWIELKNISNSPAIITGWQLLLKRGNISVVIPANSVIPAHSFYLLERTDDNSVPSIPADFIYIGSLANADDGLRLVDGNCTAADDIDGSPSWPAGNAASRTTMERAADFSWHDYSGAGTSGIFGTPRAENSAPPTIKAGSAQGGSSSAAPASVQSSSAQTASLVQSVSAPPTSPQKQFARGDVIINEFMFDAVGTDAGNEFVELYNPTDAPADLAGWSLQVQSGAANAIKKKNFDDGLSIPANGCFLVWLGTPPADARPQFTWSSGSLNNTAATIYVSAGGDAVQSASDASVIDSVRYVADDIPGFAAGMSAERVGETDAVRARQAPSPGSCVRLADDEPVPNGGATGMAHAPTAPLTTPVITFGKNPDGVGSRIDVTWNNYPFIPQTLPSTWTGMVFYLNHAPDGSQYLTTDNRLASGSEAAMQLQYPNIRTGSFPMENMLILPDVQGRMSTDNGLAGDSYNYDKLAQDSAAHITTPTDGKKGDYLTAGYYRFWGSGGGSQTMELVYADPKKIYFK